MANLIPSIDNGFRISAGEKSSTFSKLLHKVLKFNDVINASHMMMHSSTIGRRKTHPKCLLFQLYWIPLKNVTVTFLEDIMYTLSDVCEKMSRIVGYDIAKGGRNETDAL